MKVKRQTYKGFVLLSCIVSLILNISCRNIKKEEDKTEVKVIKTAMVTLDSILLTEDFNAYVEAYVKNNIVPQSPNRLSKVYVEVGDRVHKGQILASCDDSDLKQAELRLKNAETDFQRLKELHDIGGISDKDFEAQKMAYELQKTTYENLRKNTMLRSPISGVVTQRNYDAGDMVTQAPVVVVEKIAPLKMNINVSEQFYRYLKKNAAVKISFDILPGETFIGEIALIHPTMDPQSRTFTAEVFLGNKNQRIRPGMFGKATVEFSKEEVLLVPDKAVRTLPGTNDMYVFTHENGHVYRKSIEVGKLYGEQYQVMSGLSIGEIVVTAGLNALKDGDAATLAVE